MSYTLKLNEIKPHIVGRTNETPPWRHSGRKLEYNHLVLIVTGECICSVENSTYTLRAHDLCFIPANKFYSLKTTTHCEYVFLCFFGNCSVTNEAEQKICETVLPAPTTKFFLSSNENFQEEIICLPEYVSLNAKEYSDIITAFIHLQQLTIATQYLDRLLIDLYVKEIVLLVSKQYFYGKNQKYPHALEQMMAYIQENYTERITSASLSEKFCLSKEHISTLFSANLDVTAGEYINCVKLSHATELLSNSSMNVSQIAEYLGFSILHYFSRVFKKILRHFAVKLFGSSVRIRSIVPLQNAESQKIPPIRPNGRIGEILLLYK